MLPRLRQTHVPEQPRLPEDAVLQFVEAARRRDRRIVRRQGRRARHLDQAATWFALLADTFRPLWARPRVLDPEVSPSGRRVLAPVIDHGILLTSISWCCYFTLRLTACRWPTGILLPVLPMAAFLLLLKIAYLSAFTPRPGADDRQDGDAHPRRRRRRRPTRSGRALRRARAWPRVDCRGTGAPFLAALGDPARRGVHDPRRAAGSLRWPPR
jgi:hypothetical protein